MSISENTWVVGLICAVAGAGIYEYGKFMIKKLESMRGVFSGQYMALYGKFNEGWLELEFAKCRHNGDSLSGTIDAVAYIEFDKITGKISRVTDEKGAYHFDGFVDGRVLVISYRSKIRRAQSSGSIALKGDDSGEVFSGVWAGLSAGKIDNTSCVWVRLNPSVSGKREDLLTQVQEYLTKYRFGSSKISLTAQTGTGKSMPITLVKGFSFDKTERQDNRTKKKGKTPD
jgi:hypothetical protein